MQNPIEKFRQSSTVFRKPDILSENLKTFTSYNYPTVCLNLGIIKYTLLSRKRAKIQQNILNYGSWSSSKFSVFLSKKPGFLEIIEVCLNLGIRFCIN